MVQTLFSLAAGLVISCFLTVAVSSGEDAVDKVTPGFPYVKIGDFSEDLAPVNAGPLDIASGFPPALQGHFPEIPAPDCGTRGKGSEMRGYPDRRFAYRSFTDHDPSCYRRQGKYLPMEDHHGLRHRRARTLAG